MTNYELLLRTRFAANKAQNEGFEGLAQALHEIAENLLNESKSAELNGKPSLKCVVNG